MTLKLPLLEADGTFNNDYNYALKILLRSIGLECKEKNYAQKNQDFLNKGIVNSTSDHLLEVFKTRLVKYIHISYCKILLNKVNILLCVFNFNNYLRS